MKNPEKAISKPRPKIKEGIGNPKLYMKHSYDTEPRPMTKKERHKIMEMVWPKRVVLGEGYAVYQTAASPDKDVIWIGLEKLIYGEREILHVLKNPGNKIRLIAEILDG